MSEKSITRRSAADLGAGRSEHRRLRRMTDKQIADAVERDEDAARIDIDWSKADVVLPGAKQALSIRLDREVIDYFKGSGPGYQTRINAVLRAYIQHKTRAKA